MNTFDIQIRQAGKMVNFSTLAKSSADAYRVALGRVVAGVAFRVSVRRAHHG